MVRNNKGQFVKGHANVGGGRKPKSYEAKLLAAVSDSVSADDIKDIMNALKKKAKNGSIEAARVVLAYAVGMPVQKSEVTGENGGAIVLKVVYDK